MKSVCTTVSLLVEMGSLGVAPVSMANLIPSKSIYPLLTMKRGRSHLFLSLGASNLLAKSVNKS